MLFNAINCKVSLDLHIDSSYHMLYEITPLQHKVFVENCKQRLLNTENRFLNRSIKLPHY